MEVIEADIIKNQKNADLVFTLKNVIQKFKPTTIIHLAAQAGVRLPVEDYKKYVDSNLNAFVNITTSSVNSSVENILYASSSSVYGNTAKLPYSESDSNLHPLSFYGVTKLTNELMAEVITKNSGIKTRGLRFFTAYGTYGRPDMAYFKIAKSLIQKSTFELNGDGSIKRDFTNISDVVESIELLTEELNERDTSIADIVNIDRKSTRLNSSHTDISRMPSSA